jgi:nucleotide-binding universal stress UspA family protein
MNARVVVMHAITDTSDTIREDTPRSWDLPAIANNDLWNLGSMEDLSAGLVEYLDKIRTHLGDPSIETVIETGDPSDAILKVAERVNADMIVMGSHSRRGLEKILMGSVAEKVLRHTEKPMFVIPVRNQ